MSKKIKEEMTLNEFAKEQTQTRDDKLIIRQLVNLYPNRFKDGSQTVLKKKQLEDILNHYMRDVSQRRPTLKLKRRQEKTKDKVKGNGTILESPDVILEKDLPNIDMSDV